MSVLLLILLVVVKYLVVTRLGHVLEFSPGGLYAHIGETEVEIPWDSITGIEVYRGHGFGRDEGQCLFVGPPRDVRRSMRRSQVWLPWERGVHAALNPDAPRTPDA